MQYENTNEKIEFFNQIRKGAEKRSKSIAYIFPTSTTFSNLKTSGECEVRQILQELLDDLVSNVLGLFRMNELYQRVPISSAQQFAGEIFSTCLHEYILDNGEEGNIIRVDEMIVYIEDNITEQGVRRQLKVNESILINQEYDFAHNDITKFRLASISGEFIFGISTERVNIKAKEGSSYVTFH